MTAHPRRPGGDPQKVWMAIGVLCAVAAIRAEPTPPGRTGMADGGRMNTAILDADLVA